MEGSPTLDHRVFAWKTCRRDLVDGELGIDLNRNFSIDLPVHEMDWKIFNTHEKPVSPTTMDAN